MSSYETRDLANRLHSAAIHLLRRVRRTDRRTGLTPARLSALSVLVFAGPMTLGALADAEQVRPPTMSRLVQELVRKGLVRRRIRRTDRRSVEVEATPAGVELLESGRRLRVEQVEQALTLLSRRDRRRLGEAVLLIEGLDLPAAESR